MSSPRNIAQKEKLNTGKASITTGDLPGITVRQGVNPRLIVSSPHSGRQYPDHFLNSSCRTLNELRQVEDAFVDILLTYQALEAMLIHAKFPRSFVDANRDQNELERHMFDYLSDDIKVKSSRYTKAGLGVIPSQISYRKPIYSQKLTEDDLKQRLAACYNPYHDQLNAMIENGKTMGEVVLLDIHSMPSGLGVSDADIIIGTCHGQSTPAWLGSWAKAFFINQGLNTRMNTPFAGGFITKHYGKPSKSVFAIQIEINRRLYMNENTIQLLPEWHRIADILASMINKISRSMLIDKLPIIQPDD